MRVLCTIDRDKLPALMVRQGLNWSGLARTTGLSMTAIAAIKNGQHSSPKTARLVAEALNVDVDDITTVAI